MEKIPINALGKGEGKVLPYLFAFLTEHHTRKAYCENGGIAMCILDLGTRRK
jgi:hypothetical protein